ncbi:MAG: 3-oxoacyl-ACP reductase [Gemmatimonadetes bacterium]|nr:3-oxoacyl-ACP reductase [Gemmatimonadota bacterium]|tara:strand:+ start:1366 stop:2142 length:777 start_codon:yes stop_codon:yes gene_type:complete
MDLHLKDKVALITGGSRGIGKCIADCFAAEGADLGICARDSEVLNQAVTDLQKHGTTVIGIPTDVTESGATEAFVNGAVEQLGRLDALVCNVGGREGEGLEDSTDEDWMRTFDLNLFHAVRASRASIPHFRKSGGGSITIISSISGWKPAPSRAQYGATKAAEMFLAGAFAWELGEIGVRVNTVCPGSTMFEGGAWDRFRNDNPEGYERFADREFPTKRLGTPEEIADATVFLASDRASWVNGASIPVDGAQGRPNAF